MQGNIQVPLVYLPHVPKAHFTMQLREGKETPIRQGTAVEPYKADCKCRKAYPADSSELLPAAKSPELD
jgi:hypothetical protein